MAKRAFEVNKVIKGLVAYYMAENKEITKCAFDLQLFCGDCDNHNI